MVDKDGLLYKIMQDKEGTSAGVTSSRAIV